MLNSDDKLNIIILVAVLAFLAWAVPARMQEHDDADMYRSIVNAMRR